MGMVTLFDNGHTTIEVRDDIAHEFEVCPHCQGRPYRSALVGESLRGGWAFGGWSMYETYRFCFQCSNGVIRHRGKAKGEA